MSSIQSIQHRAARAYGRAVSTTYRHLFAGIADRVHGITGDNTRGSAFRSKEQRDSRRCEKLGRFMDAANGWHVGCKFGRI